MKVRVFCGIVAMMSSLAVAQQAAPRETVAGKVGGKEVSIEYGRPALKGRSLDSLMSQLPPGRVWRAGSEQVTTLKTAGEIMVGGQKVPAGEYSVYVQLSEQGNPTLLLNSVLGQPLGKIWAQAPANLKDEPWPHFNYDDEIKGDEVARAEMENSRGSNADLFTIGLKQDGNAAQLSMAWGDQVWTVALKPAM